MCEAIHAFTPNHILHLTGRTGKNIEFPYQHPKFKRGKPAEPPTLSAERYPRKIPDKKRITHTTANVKQSVSNVFGNLAGV